MMKKYSQSGMTVKIHTNHDSVRATVIMLRSNAASSSRRSPVMVVKQASEMTSAALRVNNQELALMSFPMRCVESHIQSLQTDYLNYYDKDSNWLIVACSMRV